MLTISLQWLVERCRSLESSRKDCRYWMGGTKYFCSLQRNCSETIHILIPYIYLQVRHSQRYNDTPLLISCWIICDYSSEVSCVHCNRMAGLGEACMHNGAVLFYLEASTKISNEVTCRQQKYKWIIPGYQRDIPYLPVKDIDFTLIDEIPPKLWQAVTLLTESVSQRRGTSTVSKSDSASYHIKLSPLEHLYGMYTVYCLLLYTYICGYKP